jgi:hypothetical protein
VVSKPSPKEDTGRSCTVTPGSASKVANFLSIEWSMTARRAHGAQVAGPISRRGPRWAARPLCARRSSDGPLVADTSPDPAANL